MEGLAGKQASRAIHKCALAVSDMLARPGGDSRGFHYQLPVTGDWVHTHLAMRRFLKASIAAAGDAPANSIAWIARQKGGLPASRSTSSEVDLRHEPQKGLCTKTGNFRFSCTDYLGRYI